MEEKKNKLDSYLKENWSKMEFTPSEDVWDQLSFSLREEQFDSALRSSYDAFDEAPSDAVFHGLMADLSENQTLQSGFDDWEEQLPVPGFESLRQDLNNDLFDQSIKESYEQWSGGNSRDLWEKLDEELSRESVWLRLQYSLNSYRYEPTLWKSIAAVAAMLLLVFRVSDEPSWRNAGDYSGAVAVTQTTDTSTSLKHGLPAVAAVQMTNNREKKHLVSGADNPNSEMNNDAISAREREIQETADLFQEPNRTDVVEAPAADVIDEAYHLPNLGISPVSNELAMRYPESNKHFNHFSVEAGSQLAILTERSESSLSTFTPGLGFGGNINYRYALGPIVLSHGIGYSSYNQQAGDYVNGRYRTGDQRLNAVQFNTVAGVNLKRVQLYGGFVLSRVLSGIERSGSTVTKVYHFDPIAPGIVTGLNVNLFDFGKSSLGTGVQYSWVRGLTNKENSLSNVQGIRLNLIYSF